MDLPVLLKGQALGMLGAASTAKALRGLDVGVFHEFSKASVEALAQIVGVVD